MRNRSSRFIVELRRPTSSDFENLQANISASHRHQKGECNLSASQELRVQPWEMDIGSRTRYKGTCIMTIWTAISRTGLLLASVLPCISPARQIVRQERSHSRRAWFRGYEGCERTGQYPSNWRVIHDLQYQRKHQAQSVERTTLSVGACH